MLTLNDLIELEDSFSSEKPVKVRKFRDQPKQKQTQTTHNNYRIITNELLD
jgi:hypothetical protein